MIGPSSYISKVLFTLLLLLVAWFAYMDVLLYIRIRNYPVDRSTYNTPPVLQYAAAVYDAVATTVYHHNASTTIVSATSQSVATAAYNNRSSSTNCASLQQWQPRPVEYADVVWIPCTINPLCHVTIKALLLDHTNQYLFAPAATLFDQAIGLSLKQLWISANAISVMHVFVAIAAGRWIAADTLAQRRLGVVAFQVRTFLDDLDGHVARQRRNVRGERSEVGTAGYYMDGFCDALGCVALLIGIYAYLRYNPPRRGYTQLQTVPMVHMSSSVQQQPQQQQCGSRCYACIEDEKCSSDYGIGQVECGGTTTYKAKNGTHKVSGARVARHVLVLGVQLLVSSSGWNRYIALYQELLETNDVPREQCDRQTFVLRSQLFFAVTWMWRVVNVHAMLHAVLLAAFCDRLWWWLRKVQCWGFVVLGVVVFVTEMHAMDVKQFVWHAMANGNGATIDESASVAEWAF